MTASRQVAHLNTPSSSKQALSRSTKTDEGRVKLAVQLEGILQHRIRTKQNQLTQEENNLR